MVCLAFYYNLPGFVGDEKEPNPCEATLPPPVLKVPLGFWSPKAEEVWPNPKAFAPLFPKRLLEPSEEMGKQS